MIFDNKRKRFRLKPKPKSRRRVMICRPKPQQLGICGGNNNKIKDWYGTERTVPELLCLIHSEISEALEAWHRDGLEYWTQKNDKPEGIASELADAVIWIKDTVEFLKIDLEVAIDRENRNP